MKNKRQSQLVSTAGSLVMGMWSSRHALISGFGYFLLILLLFSGSTGDLNWLKSVRAGEISLFETWQWSTFKPLCWVMMHSFLFALAVAVVSCGLAFLICSLAVLPKVRKGEFAGLARLGRCWQGVPMLLIGLLVMFGSDGSRMWVAIVLSLFAGVGLCEKVSGWFERASSGNDVEAAILAGVRYRDQTLRRYIVIVGQQVLGVMLGLIPKVMLIEMMLSFVGSGFRWISVGTLLGIGKDRLYAEPELLVVCGSFSFAVVLGFGVLGWFTGRYLKSGSVSWM
ncbi:MAG: hypothetical protein AAF226_10705 [Verrucomicrobiota bacterium]